MFFFNRKRSDIMAEGQVGMNFFEEPKSIIEGLAMEDIAVEEKRFFSTALEIRRKLDKRTYLLDNYLSMLLIAIHVSNAESAFQEGFEAYGDLLHATRQAMNREKDGLPQFPLIGELYCSYHVKCQESQTACSLTNVTTSLKVIPDMAGEYAEKMEGEHRAVYDSLTMQRFYREISQLVGEEIMERLSEAVERRFLTVRLLDAFFQGFTSQCLYSLLYRDIETNKQVLQLVLDEMERADG